MKNLMYKSVYWVLIIGIALSNISCQKEEERPIVPIYEQGNTIYGSAEGAKEGREWKASGHGLRHIDGASFLGVSLGTVSAEGFLRESLRLGYIPIQKGSYPISNTHDDLFVTARYRTLADDGDVLEDSYIVDETVATNIAEITRIDTVAKVIEGIFTVTFNIADPEDKQNPINPDRVTFSDVSFSVDIIR